MQARLTTKPEPEVIAAIHALDLEPVKLRMMHAELGEGWTREYADSIGVAYQTYLTMLVKYPDDAEDILLSEDVDEFWHTHILQTRKYMQDCQNVFGNYLHHEPHVGEVTAAAVLGFLRDMVRPTYRQAGWQLRRVLTDTRLQLFHRR